MSALICDICGGDIVINSTGEFAVCESCGMKHSKERVQAKVQEIKGTVAIKGTVNVEGIANANNIISVGFVDLEQCKIGGIYLKNQEQYQLTWDCNTQAFRKALEISPHNNMAILGLMLQSQKNCKFYYNKLTHTSKEMSVAEKDFIKDSKFPTLFLAAYIEVEDVERCEYVLENSKCILQQGRKVTQSISEVDLGYSLLWYAVSKKNSKIINLLLNNGASLNYKDPYSFNSIIDFACSIRDISTVEALLKYCSKSDITHVTINNAIKSNNLETLKLLLDSGGDISGDIETQPDHREGGPCFWKHPMAVATLTRDSDALKILLDHGGNPNFCVCFEGEKPKRLLKLLVEEGKRYTEDGRRKFIYPKVDLLRQYGGKKGLFF